MAKAAAKPEETKEDNQNSGPVIPSGFKSVTAESGVPWLQKEEGLVITGRLLGRFIRRSDRGGAFYQVRLAQGPLPGQTGSKRKGDLKAVEVPAGKTIAFDEMKALEDLACYADSDGVYDVWIHLKGKVDLPNGNTFWDTDIHVKQLQPPSHPIVKNNGADDVPF